MATAGATALYYGTKRSADKARGVSSSAATTEEKKKTNVPTTLCVFALLCSSLSLSLSLGVRRTVAALALHLGRRRDAFLGLLA